MVNGLTNCVEVKTTPNDTRSLNVLNPTGILPKLIHVKCDHDSAVYTSDGAIREGWFIQSFGFVYTTNGATGVNAYYSYTPVQQTPTANNTYFLSENSVELYKGGGSSTGLWNTSTEYTVEIYTDDYQYIIWPNSLSTSDRGSFATKRINLTTGQKITIDYYGITHRSGNGFIDGYFAGTSPSIVYTRDLTANDGTIVLTATKNGYISIGNNRNSDEGSLTGYAIRQIRIKVE